MAEIAQIKLPSDSTTYDLKDTAARTAVSSCMLKTVVVSGAATTNKIRVGTTDPTLVDTTGWTTGELYIYIKNS